MGENVYGAACAHAQHSEEKKREDAVFASCAVCEGENLSLKSLCAYSYVLCLPGPRDWRSGAEQRSGRCCFPVFSKLSPVSAQPTAKLLIGGKFVESKTDKWINNYNPATQEMVTRVPCATQVQPASTTFTREGCGLHAGGDECGGRGGARGFP